jgi:predicted lipoprotein with Yx(FWY)xxD motif
MKKTWIWIVLIVLIVAVGYAGRHKLKSMMGGSSAPVAMAPTAAPTSAPLANGIFQVKTDASKGQYLADPKGMTLYIFDKDTSGVSNCSGQCAAIWPVYGPASAAPTGLPTNVAVITRKDGTFQYTYKGMPLYYYAKDKAVGDTIGDGVGGIWHLAKQ